MSAEAAQGGEGRQLLGQILKARGVLKEGPIQTALGAQRKGGGLIGQCMVDMGACSQGDVAMALGEQAGMETVDLSTFAPDVFAKRDAAWAAGDPEFFELNDWLQYLGFFTFRPPVPAYKHSAAMFLKLRGWIDCDDTHPDSPTRPESDSEILRAIVERLA